MPSYSFSSSSHYSSSSSSSHHSGHHSGGSHACSSERRSGPQGTTVRTTTQTDGQPAVEETRHFDPSGREVPQQTLDGASSARARVDDVSGETGTDRAYRERMEDEYAKREGGA